MAAEKRGIYFGRMLNLLVSTFRPRTERDFPSNDPQPIEITAFLRRIYFGRACQKTLKPQRFQGFLFAPLQFAFCFPEELPSAFSSFSVPHILILLKAKISLLFSVLNSTFAVK